MDDLDDLLEMEAELGFVEEEVEERAKKRQRTKDDDMMMLTTTTNESLPNSLGLTQELEELVNENTQRERSEAAGGRNGEAPGEMANEASAFVPDEITETEMQELAEEEEEEEEEDDGSEKEKKSERECLLAEPVNVLLERIERKRVQRLLDKGKALLSESGQGLTTGEGEDPDKAANTSGGHNLLATKYKPKRFVELLSDEKVNREVVKWLKGWDEAEDKVILLCGPPGTGKTTLAHVAAHQCGYRTVEINAGSNSGGQEGEGEEGLKAKIRDAMQMQSIRDSRPSLLIIELDECPKKKLWEEVKRPIILVSNDFLRYGARIFKFKQVDSRKLKRRLAQICSRESIEVEGNALQALCESSDGDIRTCLNTLQLSLQERKLSASTLANIGKDKRKTLWKIMDVNKKSKKMEENLAELFKFGETDLLVQGFHENVYDHIGMDITLSQTNKCAEWFAFADEMSDVTNFSLNSYRLVAVLGAAEAMMKKGSMQLRWPKMDREASKQMTSQANVLHSWMKTTGGSSTSAAVLEVIPALCTSLVPTGLRPVAPELMRAKERVTLKRVVDHMQTYGLSLVNKNKDESMGGFVPRTTYSLQPEIDTFHRYSGRKTSDGISMNSAVKQIITYELETRKIRSHRESSVKQSQSLEGKDSKKKKASKARTQQRVLAEKNNHWLNQMKANLEHKKEWAAGAICREHVYPMLYTYHEGVTNAVKRRVLLQEIM